MSKVPNSKPQMSQSDVEKIISAKGVDRKKFPVCVLAVRGYYLDTMGARGKNDRGIFDDAAFVTSPTLFASVNWNTDPSSYRKGRGTGSAKGMASLKPGVWDYRIGAHKGRSPAGNQAGPVTVIRDGIDGDYADTGYFGINLHWGSSVGTSSAGCQTAPPNQWPSFITPLVAELKRYGQKIFKYVLIDVAEMKELLSVDSTVKTEVKAQEGAKEERDLAPALSLIKQFEGLRLSAYEDAVGVWTIGWGTTKYPDGKKVKRGDKCSTEQAHSFLMHDVSAFVSSVERLVKVPLSNNSFCALVSFCYNLGAGALGKSSLLKRLNKGEPIADVAPEFLKWVNAGGQPLKGLVRRREAEMKLFLS